LGAWQLAPVNESCISISGGIRVLKWEEGRWVSVSQKLVDLVHRAYDPQILRSSVGVMRGGTVWQEWYLYKISWFGCQACKLPCCAVPELALGKSAIQQQDGGFRACHQSHTGLANL